MLRFEDVRAQPVAAGQLAVWWLGQASFLLKTHHGDVLLLDPWLTGGAIGSGQRPERLDRVPVQPEDLRPDLVCITHDHLDHLDAATLRRLPADLACPLVGPRFVVRSLREQRLAAEERLVRLDVGETWRFRDRLTIRATFCIPNEEKVLDTIGLLIEPDGGPSFYMVGDSGYHDFLYYLAKYRLDVMAIPINGGLGNLPQADACQLVRLLRPGCVVPYHYGSFPTNTADPADFRKLLYASHAEPPLRVLTPGTVALFTRTA